MFAPKEPEHVALAALGLALCLILAIWTTYRALSWLA